MKRFLVWLLVLFGTAETASAQLSRYIIQLNDKATSPYSITNPQQYLSQRSIDRRSRHHIAIDSTDLPVTPRYLDSLRAVPNVTILNVSKWLNQVTIKTTDAAAIQKINSFPFVKTASPIAARILPGTTDKLQGVQAISQTSKVSGLTADYYNYGNAAAQIRIHNGDFLHNIGLRGQNMVIGMLDAGFYNYTSLKSFDSINANGQVLETWDFVTRNASVAEDHPHGMQTLSLIAANVPGQFVGTAPKAHFFLFRTEDAATEFPIEEHNWVCAAERVDSAGGDVISSSLGYNQFQDASFSYTYQDMTGNRTIAANGADLAAKKGLLVVNAAGNEGNGTWKYIMTPADGDSVLAVGAVDVAGQVGSFSSYGPSADGQVKPDVAAVGVNPIIQHTNNTIGPGGNGTSYACPNMAGLTTCLWQGFQEFNNMKIINALRQAGNNYTSPNDRVGYGVPDVKKAVTLLLKDYVTATATISNCKTTFNWNSKDASSMKYEIERKAPGETAFTKIAERAGTGSVFSNQSYQLTDSLINMQSGAISYRIRQVIDTAAATFSADYMDTVTVNLGASCVLTAIDPVNVNKAVQIVPNPATHTVVLRMKDPVLMQHIKIVIINAAGQTADVQYRSKSNGAADFVLAIDRLTKGRYTVLVYNNTQLLASEELIKL